MPLLPFSSYMLYDMTLILAAAARYYYAAAIVAAIEIHYHIIARY